VPLRGGAVPGGRGQDCGLGFGPQGTRLAGLARGPGGDMTIEISVPDEWTPGQAIAVRALLQQAMYGGHPLIAAIRADATPDELRDIYSRVEALLRDAGMAA